MQVRIKLLLLLLLWFTVPVTAQDNPTKKDTVKDKQDKMYKNIENYSKRSKFTKFIHKLIFKPVRKKEASEQRKNTKKTTPELQNTYQQYEGKVIRNIDIETLDPFGYSISDTTRKPDTWLEKLGNHVHLKTKNFAIKNLLLFKKNERLDSLLVKESERLIRARNYTRRVVIKPVPIPNSQDSVDIYIRVLDSWSLIPNGSASGSGSSVELTERNFFGLGHEFQGTFDKNFNNNQSAFITRYRATNIKNTYIDAEINYQILKSESSLKSVGLNREFFSAYTRWAGGVYFEERLVRDSLPDAQDVWAIQNQKSEAQDYWGGYSFKVFKGFTEEDRTTNLVTTGRFFERIYKESPTVAYDSINFYSDEKLYLASVGITSRKFVQDKFLFNYDIVEDIPIGKVYSATFGRQTKNNQHRVYLGGRYAFGNYYKWGYFSANAEVGSFLYKMHNMQSVFKLDMLYFSNIRDWGKWRFRHFVKPTVVFGENREPIITDQLHIEDRDGLQGFNRRLLMGTKKFLLTLQTQTYSPWNIAGFRLNPFVNFTMGMLGDNIYDLYDSKVYTKVGVGLLIYNDYLIFNSFQVSMSFYPSIPGQGNNIFRSNTLKNTDVTLPDFQVGKPVTVPYE